MSLSRHCWPLISCYSFIFSPIIFHPSLFLSSPFCLSLSSLLPFCHSSSVFCCCLVWSDFAQTRLALGKVRSPESLLRSPQVASTMNTLWSPFPSCCHGSSFGATRRLRCALLIHWLEEKFWKASFDQSIFPICHWLHEDLSFFSFSFFFLAWTNSPAVHKHNLHPQALYPTSLRYPVLPALSHLPPFSHFRCSSPSLQFS